MYRQSWLAFTVLLVGCATVPLATDEQDNQAKQFKTSMEHSTIYLVTGASEFILAGSHNVFNVSVDGQDATGLAQWTYTVVTVPGGKHTVRVQGPENQSKLVLDTVPGTVVMVQVRVTPGWMSGRADLIIVDEVRGKELVQKSKMVSP